MTTLLTTCITNLNQKLKNQKEKNLTQLDAHGSSDQCCHYIKMKLRFYQYIPDCLSKKKKILVHLTGYLAPVLQIA